MPTPKTHAPLMPTAPLKVKSAGLLLELTPMKLKSPPSFATSLMPPLMTTQLLELLLMSLSPQSPLLVMEPLMMLVMTLKKVMTPKKVMKPKKVRVMKTPPHTSSPLLPSLPLPSNSDS